ncbi:MAG: c-type cytochrome, partial [Planctomycetota bacterium]|nr:c-type cytochrome [Planctomycetota bacterium]
MKPTWCIWKIFPLAILCFLVGVGCLGGGQETENVGGPNANAVPKVLKNSGPDSLSIQKMQLARFRETLSERMRKIDDQSREATGKGIQEVLQLESKREVLGRPGDASASDSLRLLVEQSSELKREISDVKNHLGDVVVRRRSAQKALDRAEYIFVEINELEERIKGLERDISFGLMAINYLKGNLSQTVVPNEREGLLKEIKDQESAIVPLKKMWQEFKQKQTLLIQPKTGYEEHYQGLRDQWKAKEKSARQRLKRLRKQSDSTERNLDIETAKEVGFDSGLLPKIEELVRAAKRVQRDLATERILKPEEAAGNGCMLCHHQMDSRFLAGGRLRLTETHPALPGDAGSCASCHGGVMSASTFAGAGHYTIDSEVEERWKKSYDYVAPSLDQGVMIPRTHTKMEGPLTRESFSEEADRGAYLFERHRCWACHSLPGYQAVMASGPSLDQLHKKVNYSWLVRWLKDPADYTKHHWRPRIVFSEVEAQKLGSFLWALPRPSGQHSGHDHGEHGHGHGEHADHGEHGHDHGEHAEHGEHGHDHGEHAEHGEHGHDHGEHADHGEHGHDHGEHAEHGEHGHDHGEHAEHGEHGHDHGEHAEHGEHGHDHGEHAEHGEQSGKEEKSEEPGEQKDPKNPKRAPDKPQGLHSHGGGAMHSHDGPVRRLETPAPSPSAVKAGRVLFQKRGCAGCHRLDLPVERTRPTIDLTIMVGGRRLTQAIWAKDSDRISGKKPLYPVGTRLNRKIVEDLQRRGIEKVRVRKTKRWMKVGDTLLDQNARLQFAYPDEELAIYPAGHPVDREVLDTLQEDGKKKIAISGIGRDFGPDLTRAGEKFHRGRLVAWIMDPQKQRPGTIMPHFGYGVVPASSLVSYLLSLESAQDLKPYRHGVWVRTGRQQKESLRVELWQSTPSPAVGIETRFGLRLRSGGQVIPVERMKMIEGTLVYRDDSESLDSPVLAVPDVRYQEMVFRYVFPRTGKWEIRFELSVGQGESRRNETFVFEVAVFDGSQSIEEGGRKLIQTFQCAACHQIPYVKKLPAVPLMSRLQGTPGDLYAKLQNGVRDHHIGRKSGPANYAFNEDDSEALVSFMMRRLLAEPKTATSSEEALVRGWSVLQRHNCLGCHQIAGQGGTYGPDLTWAGLRYRPLWLENFLRTPHVIRRTDPSNDEDVVPVMPRMSLNEKERSDLLRFFDEMGRDKSARSAIEEVPEIKSRLVNRGRELVQANRCSTCHWIGGKEPTPDKGGAEGMIQQLSAIRKKAPPLGPQTINRLDPGWMASWIHDPMRWNPDTAMPKVEMTLQDAVAIRDYLLQAG